MGRWQVAALALLGGVGVSSLPGCAVVEALGIEPPSASLNRVDLIDSPSTDQLLGYGCNDVLGLGSLCDTAGLSSPPKKAMQFSFDLVFDLENPNTSIPIPLIETLLGFTAFEDANLGSVCISFCDPEDDTCVPGTNVEGACEAKPKEQVDEPEDLIPSVEDLVGLAEAVESGEYDNGDFRVLEPGTTMESHIGFELGIDPMLQIADELINQAVNDFIGGKNVKLDVPYTVQGTLFFDVPEMGRKAIGFGPLADTWQIK